MAAGPRERLGSLIKDVEKATKQLRADIRKRAETAPKNMKAAANRLRKGAADIAGQVEKYIHDVRVGLEGAKPAPKRGAKRKSTARRKSRV